MKGASFTPQTWANTGSVCDLGAGHTYWSRSQENCARVQSEEDFQSYLGSAPVWKAGSGELVKHPWRGTWLWMGNLCFGEAGWRKTSKSLCNSPWTGAFTSPAPLVTNHTSLCLTVTARLEKPCHPDLTSGARGFTELFFAVFWEFLKKTLSVGDFTSWEKSSCWCFTAQISLRSVKSQLDTTMIDFIDFPPSSTSSRQLNPTVSYSAFLCV